MPVKTENYMLPDAVSVINHRGEKITLPAGSYVKPVSPQYVPKHITENSQWAFFNSTLETFVYCRFGFVVIYKSQLRPN